MEQKTYIHKKICLCKKCSGTGVEVFYAKDDVRQEYPLQRKCPQCNGTGRVIVYGERTLKIEPYEPEPTVTTV